MCSLINKQLLLTAYAYLFIMEQQKAQQGSEALQVNKTSTGLAPPSSTMKKFLRHKWTAIPEVKKKVSTELLWFGTEGLSVELDDARKEEVLRKIDEAIAKYEDLPITDRDVVMQFLSAFRDDVELAKLKEEATDLEVKLSRCKTCGIVAAEDPDYPKQDAPPQTKIEFVEKLMATRMAWGTKVNRTVFRVVLQMLPLGHEGILQMVASMHPFGEVWWKRYVLNTTPFSGHHEQTVKDLISALSAEFAQIVAAAEGVAKFDEVLKVDLSKDETVNRIVDFVWKRGGWPTTGMFYEKFQKKFGEHIKGVADAVAMIMERNVALRTETLQVFKDNELVCLAAVTRNGMNLRWAGKDIKKSEAVCLAAVTNELCAAKNFAPELQQSASLWLTAVKKRPGVLQVAGVMRDNEEVCREAVKGDPMVLRFANNYKIKNDEKLCLELVKRNPRVLEHAGEDVKENWEVCMEAVKQDGSVLKFAGEKVKNDKKLCLAAVSQNAYALEHVGPEMKNNTEVCQVCLGMREGKWIPALRFAGAEAQEKLKKKGYRWDCKNEPA